MNLIDLFDLKERIATATPDSTITIGKDVDCGLFAPFVGGGSCLEIACDENIVIPVSCIYDLYIEGLKPHGYDIDEVYGLIRTCWHGTILSEQFSVDDKEISVAN